jgi:hypothetical protein
MLNSLTAATARMLCRNHAKASNYAYSRIFASSGRNQTTPPAVFCAAQRHGWLLIKQIYPPRSGSARTTPRQRQFRPLAYSVNFRNGKQRHEEATMARIIDGKTHITAAEAAVALETTITRVFMLLRENALQGAEAEGEWYVASDSLACAKAHGTDMKTVKGCASYCTSSSCGCK